MKLSLFALIIIASSINAFASYRESVANYGARPDGSDSSAAFQAAINNVLENGTLDIPVGTYSISSTLTLPRAIRIVGAGRDTAVLHYTGTGVLLSYARTNVLEPLSVESLTLESVLQASIGLNIGGVNSVIGQATGPVLIDSVKVSNFTKAIVFQTNCHTSRVLDVQCNAPASRGGSIGIEIAQASMNTTIARCAFNSCETGVVTDARTIASQVPQEGITITDCTFSNVQWGVHTASATAVPNGLTAGATTRMGYINVTRNSFSLSQSPSFSAAVWLEDTWYSMVCNNTINGNGLTGTIGVYAVGIQQCTVSANILSGMNQGNGIVTTQQLYGSTALPSNLNTIARNTAPAATGIWLQSGSNSITVQRGSNSVLNNGSGNQIW